VVAVFHQIGPRTNAIARSAYSRCELRRATNVDLYDRVGLIPWAKPTAFFNQHLGQPATAPASDECFAAHLSR
jgi:hypothetical protein